MKQFSHNHSCVAFATSSLCPAVVHTRVRMWKDMTIGWGRPLFIGKLYSDKPLHGSRYGVGRTSRHSLFFFAALPYFFRRAAACISLGSRICFDAQPHISRWAAEFFRQGRRIFSTRLSHFFGKAVAFFRQGCRIFATNATPQTHQAAVLYGVCCRPPRDRVHTFCNLFIINILKPNRYEN